MPQSHLFPAVLAVILHTISSDYCGTEQIAFGFEVHHSGITRLLCSKPDCFNNQYTDCPERAESTRGCPKPTQLVGGTEITIDGVLHTKCCDYEDLPRLGVQKYHQVTLRRGEFFEGEEKTDQYGDVSEFDLIKDIHMYHSPMGIPYFNLTVFTFNCSSYANKKPAWRQKSAWPYFKFH